MNWHQLQPLLLHFDTTHLDLDITWEKRGNHTQINVALNRTAVFGLGYKLQPGQSEFYQFHRTDFPQYEQLSKNLNLLYATERRTVTKRTVILTSDGRAQKYRSQTLEPIPTHQLDYDSEDEENIDSTWLKEDNEKVIKNLM